MKNMNMLIPQKWSLFFSEVTDKMNYSYLLQTNFQSCTTNQLHKSAKSRNFLTQRYSQVVLQTFPCSSKLTFSSFAPEVYTSEKLLSPSATNNQFFPF